MALFAESRPEFACIWLGMAKAGVVAALINFNLRSQALLHCLRAAEAVSLLFEGGGPLAEAVRDVCDELPGMRLYRFGEGDSEGSGEGEGDGDSSFGDSEGGQRPVENLDRLLRDADAGQAAFYRPSNLRERLFYIYTSGGFGVICGACVYSDNYRVIPGLQSHCRHHSWVKNTV